MTIFCNCQGVLLVDFLSRSTTINGPYYALLLHRLCSSIRKKRRGILRRDVLLLHDNAPLHKSNITQAAIQYTSFSEFNHLDYSLDLVPSDYYLFLNVKNFLRDRNFESDNDHELLFREF